MLRNQVEDDGIKFAGETYGSQKTFRAVIEDVEGGGAFVIIPFDVEQVFGKKKVKIVFEKRNGSPEAP